MKKSSNLSTYSPILAFLLIFVVATVTNMRYYFILVLIFLSLMINNVECLLICCSVTKSCPTLCDPMDRSTPCFPVLHYFPKFAKSTLLRMLSNHLILCHSLFLLLSIFPSIRVFSNESAPCIRWPEYWSFCFSISPFSKY